MAAIKITDEITVGEGFPLLIMAGPCVVESLAICEQIAGFLKDVCGRLELPYVFKASFDKANRTSIDSFRGPGIEQGLAVLEKIKNNVGVPVVTDIHEPGQAAKAAEVVDILQIPAFLCRQTDLVVAAAETNLPINVKKGQFMAPEDMKPVIEKGAVRGNGSFMLCERGTCFGYNNLIVDMRSIVTMKSLGKPVIFDMTHSTQRPGALGGSSGGDSKLALPLGKAAVAAGADGVFLETHPEPSKALSDAATMLRLDAVENALVQLKAVFSSA